MLSITDGGSLARALSSYLNPHLKQLLKQRSDQLGGNIGEQALFVILQPGDAPEALEQQLSFSVFQNPFDGSRFGAPDFTPGWEWIEDHGFAFELVFIFDDSGFAHVVIIPNEDSMDADLLALCRTCAAEHA
jgi:hypothetical protein